MAFEVEAWWSVNYNKFSIRDMQRLPIFHRFLQLHYPFEHSDEIVHEKFWVENNEVDIFEWTDKAAVKTERFSHNRKLREYYYEVSYSDLESPIVIKSWFQQDREWGTIIRDYGDFQIHEGWKLEPPTRIYERFTTERGIRKGFRAGIHPYKGEYERWVEEIWELDEESVFSKSWYKEGESGGETTNRKGEYTWGENWFSSAKRDEKKCWHKNGVHEWGHDSGNEAPKRWDHSWDLNAEDKYEEKVSVTNGRDTGYRFWGKQKDWYKQEWEGLHLLEREDRSEQVVSAKFRTRLDNIYVSEYNGTLKQQQTLKTLLAYLPAYAAKVQALEKTREDIHVKDRESIEALFDGIDALRGVQDVQEKLTQDMIGEFKEEANTITSYNSFFLASFNNSLKTLKQIGEVIKDESALNEFVPKVEEWRSTPRPNVQKGKAGLVLLEQLEVAKQEELLKFRGGIPKEEVEKAMNTLYQIMVKHDAVSDKIVELTHADDFKVRLDGMEDKFEEIHKNFLEEGDPNKLHEMLNLLLEYQPIHLHLVGRIRGFNKDETDSEIGRIDSAVSETKGAPSLKNTRAKVRSGKPSRDTPFQVIDRNFNFFIPLFQKLLAAVDAPKTGIEALEAVSKKSVNSTEPVDVLVEKSQVLVDVIRSADPSVDAHDQELRTTDENVNLFFTDVFPVFAALPDGEETLVAPRRALIEKSKETAYFPPLLLAKSEALRQQTPIVKDHADKGKSQVLRLSESLVKFIPYFIHHLKTVNAPAETIEALKAVAEKVPDRWYPLHTLNEQAEALLTQAQAAEPSIHAHDETLKRTDETINSAFIEAFPAYATVPNGEETLIKPRQALIEKSKETEYFPPLLLLKSQLNKDEVPVVRDHLGRAFSKVPSLAKNLSKFIPFFIGHLKTVHAPEEAAEALTAEAAKVPDQYYPLEVLDEQLEALVKHAEEAVSSVEAHNESIKASDANLNQYFQETFPLYENIEGAQEVIVEPRNALITESESTEYFPPLVQRKTEELLAHTSEVPDYINALVGEIQTLTEETTTTTTIVDDLQTTLSQKSELIDQLQRKIKELEKRLGLINDDLAEARKYKPLYEERDVVATKLANEVKELSIKASDLALHLDQANSENAGLKTQVEELTSFRLRALDLEQENAKLQGIIKSYDSVFGDKKAQFEHIITSLNDEISSRDGKIKELLDRIRVLENEIGVKDKDRKKQLMLRVIQVLANTLKVERSSTFLLWKYTSLGPEDIPPESILDKVPETAGFKDESLDANELQSFTTTEPPLVEERKLQISANIIAKHWRMSGIKFDKTAKAIETLRFWDQLLDKKAEADQADLATNKKPLFLSEFVLEHLLKTLNNRRVAQEQLGSHLPALYRLYADGHPYAVLISRLLHLFNGSPAPLEAQVVVVDYRKQFERLAQAYSESRTARNLPPKPDLDIASTGGEAPLKAVLTTFYQYLGEPQFITEHWIRYLKPSNLSLLDYVVFLVHLQLETKSKTPDSFWTSADAGNTGKTEGDAFAHAVQATGINLSTRLLREATATPLTKEDFFAKKPTDLNDDRYVVPSSGFLTGILEAYLAKVRRATVVYTKLFESAGKPHLNKAAFSELAHTLQADVPTEVLEKFHDEGLTISSTQEGLDSGAFVRVLLRHFLGSFAHPPLTIEQLHLLTEPHVTEYNLETGIKTVVSTTKTTKTITTTKKVISSKKV